MQEKYTLNSPIFIGGLFKSGTSLLRAMLGQHSAISTGLETYWFDINWDGDRGKLFQEHIERLRNFYGFEKDVIDQMVAQSESGADFIAMFLDHHAGYLGKRRWAEKTPGNVIHLKKIYSNWPDAKVIHIIRDPRDVFASLKQAKKWDTIKKFVELWCLFLGSAEKLKKELELDQNSYMEMRYEDLVLRPRESMKNVIDFLDEKWEEGLSEFEGKKSDYYKVLELTGKASTTLDRLRKPLSRDRVGLWHKIVSLEEIEQIHDLVKQEGLLTLIKRIENETPA